MFATVKNNAVVKTIRPSVGFYYDGVEYSANWHTRMNAERKAEMGIVEIVSDPEPDQRFYWVTRNNAQLIDGVARFTFTATPKNLANLKSQWSSQAKDTANKLLASTDWYVIRKLERDVAVPDDIQAFRSGVVTECARVEAAIEASEDVEALIAAVQDQQWPALAQPVLESDPVIEEPQEQLQEEVVIIADGNSDQQEEVVEGLSGNTAAMDLSDNDDSIVITGGNSEGV